MRTFYEEWQMIRDKDRNECVIEQRMVQNVKKFIMIFCKDFTFVGNQYHFGKNGVEEFPDLLFFSRELGDDKLKQAAIKVVRQVLI